MTTSDPYRTIYHRDRTVTLWDIYSQQWIRLPAHEVSDRLLATLSLRERARILRLAGEEVRS